MGDLLVAIRTRQIKTESSIWNKPKPPNNPPNSQARLIFPPPIFLLLQSKKMGGGKIRDRENQSHFSIFSRRLLILRWTANRPRPSWRASPKVRFGSGNGSRSRAPAR